MNELIKEAVKEEIDWKENHYGIFNNWKLIHSRANENITNKFDKYYKSLDKIKYYGLDT